MCSTGRETVDPAPCFLVAFQPFIRFDSFALLEFCKMSRILWKVPLCVPRCFWLVSVDIYPKDSLLKQEAKPEYLGGHVDIGPLIQKQGDHIRVPLLWGQVEWRHSLLCHDVRLCAIVEESGSYLHLILLGSNV